MLFFYDFETMWAAGRAAFAGLNPYDHQTIATVLQAEGSVEILEWPGGFLYPPWGLWLFITISFFPLFLAEILWSICGITAVAIGIRQGCYAYKKFTTTSIPLPLLLLLICSFTPILKQLTFGQSTWIVLISIVYWWHFWVRQKDLYSGLALSFAFLKLHTVFPLVILATIWSIKSKRFKVLYGILLGVTAQATISYIMAPQAFYQFLNTAQDLIQLKEHVPRATTSDFIITLFKIQNSKYITNILFIIGAAGAVLIGLLGKTSEQNRDFALLLSLATAPFCWSNDYLILLPIYTLLVGKIALKNKSLTLLILTTASLASVWVHAHWIQREVWTWLWLPFIFLLYLSQLKKSEISQLK
jgi:hypothetical protein